MLVSAANMRLKLSHAATAAAMYRFVLSECSLLPAEQEMASRKLGEARAAVLSETCPRRVRDVSRTSAVSLAADGLHPAGRRLPLGLQPQRDHHGERGLVGGRQRLCGMGLDQPVPQRQLQRPASVPGGARRARRRAAAPHDDLA